MTSHKVIKIGLISDTHGLLRPQVFEVFRDTELIIHAGDIGSPDLIKRLRVIAPVSAVRGNMDSGSWAGDFPKTETVRIGDVLLYVIHNVQELDLDPDRAGISAVIAGHSHRPTIENRSGVIFINPGSAGPRRFRLPVSVAMLHIQGKSLSAELVELDQKDSGNLKKLGIPKNSTL